jgi:hypothetical protein
MFDLCVRDIVYMIKGVVRRFSKILRESQAMD